MIARIPKTLLLLSNAIISTKREILLSLKLLLIIWLVLSVLYFISEHVAQPDVYSLDWSGVWNSFLWTFVKCIQDPGEMAPPAPITICGKIVANIVGLLGIAIFAVPAGLVGSGFMDAIAEDKREQKLHSLRRRISLSFIRKEDKQLRTYLKDTKVSHADILGYEDDIFFVPQAIPVQKIQIKQGILFDDIIDMATEFPEFILKDGIVDKELSSRGESRVMIEMTPLGKWTISKEGNSINYDGKCSYGCNINRHSNITIVATSASDELGTGWFAYYLAKLGGFNFVCKSIEVCPDDKDSFYTMKTPTFGGLSEDKWENSEDKDKDIAIKIIENKQNARTEYINDLNEYNHDDGWMVFIHENAENPSKEELNYVCKYKNGLSTVSDEDKLLKFIDACNKENISFNEDGNSLFPLDEDFIIKKLSEPVRNGFVIRPSSYLINSSSQRFVILYKLSQLMSNTLLGCKAAASDCDVIDFHSRCCGYQEKSK